MHPSNTHREVEANIREWLPREVLGFRSNTSSRVSRVWRVNRSWGYCTYQRIHSVMMSAVESAAGWWGLVRSESLRVCPGRVSLPSSSLLTLLPGFHGARSFLAPYLSALELPTLDLTLGNYEPNKLVLL